MAKCSSCSAETGTEVVVQANGKVLCSACDIRSRAAAAEQRPVDTLNITFCPKCSSVWNRAQTYCEKCHWDVVSQQHVEVKAPEKRTHVRFDLMGAAMGLVVIIAGYIGYSYYRDAKKKERDESLALQERDLQAQRNNEEAQRRANEEELERVRRNQLKFEDAKSKAELEKLKVADTRMTREAEMKVKQELLERQREADAAQRRANSEAEIAARKAAEKKDAEDQQKAAGQSKERRIADLTQDLKAAEAALKKAQQAIDPLQPQISTFKNRIDYCDKQCAELRNAMNKVIEESKNAGVSKRVVLDARGNPKEVFDSKPVTLRTIFTTLHDDPKEAVYPPAENNFESQAQTIKQKFNSIRKERNDAVVKYNAARDKFDMSKGEVTGWEAKISDLRKALGELGVAVAGAAKTTPAKAPESTPVVPSTSSAAPTEPAVKPALPKGKELKVYTLKDGTVIRAVSTVDSEGEVTVKDEFGKFRTIAKNDIEKMEVQNAQ